jgi:hypothetical protein
MLVRLMPSTEFVMLYPTTENAALYHWRPVGETVYLDGSRKYALWGPSWLRDYLRSVNGTPGRKLDELHRLAFDPSAREQAKAFAALGGSTAASE